MIQSRKIFMDFLMPKPKLVLIGSSTGGPSQLHYLLDDIILPPHVSLVIAQHMKTFFMNNFVEQFKEKSKSQIELLDCKKALRNKIYICAKNSVFLPSKTLVLKPDESGIETFFNPNIDMLFTSAVGVCDFVDVLAIIMTGMGDDGAKGLDLLRKAGAVCVGENEESCIVYGMSKKAKEINQDLEMCSLEEIKLKIESFIK